METDDVNHSRTLAVYKGMKNILKTSLVVNIILGLVVFCLYIACRCGLFCSGVILLPNTTTTATLVNSEGLGSKTTCITCGFTVTDPGTTLYDYITKTASNTNLCCLANDPDEQDIILELAATGNEQFYEGPYTQKLKWWTERNYAAHVYADHLSGANKLIWTIGRHSTSFVRNLTLFTDDQINLTVPDAAGAGKYFVYSLFTFDFRDEDAIKDDQIIWHRIMKYNNYQNETEAEKIFQSTRGNERMSQRQTTYLGGVVTLKQSDTVYVSVFTISLKRYEGEKYIDVSSPYHNYFGMFKLE